MSEDRPVGPNRPALSATSDLPAGVPVESALQPVEATVVVPAPSAASTPVPAPEKEPQPIAERFGQLAARRREAEARADQLERTAAEFKAQLETALAALKTTKAPAAAPTRAPASSDDGGLVRPIRDSYPDQESFEADLVSWAGTRAAQTASAELRRVQGEAETARQEQARIAEETRSREVREAEEAKTAREMQTSWEERRAKAIEAHPDFAEVVEADSLPITLAMGHMIVTREDGPEIAYFLGKNPKEAARIAALSVPGQTFPVGHPQAGLPVPNAVAQAFELGRIAAKLSGGTAPPVVPVEPASSPPAPSTPEVASPQFVVLPAPPTSISGASAAATRRDLTTIGNDPNAMEEYATVRRPQLLAERRPGRIH